MKEGKAVLGGEVMKRTPGLKGGGNSLIISKFLAIAAVLSISLFSEAQNVGIGTNSPTARLHIEVPSGFTSPVLQVNQQGSATPYLIVQPNGNVGIGVASPSEALDVSGNIQFSGALMPGGNAGTAGQVLVSQGVSVKPIWKTPSWDSVCQTAAFNYIQKWTGSEFCNSQFYDNGLMIGVRTNTPAAYFDIEIPSGLTSSSIPLFRINAPGNPIVTVYGLAGIRRIGVNTTSPEDVLHITYSHGGSWPYFRSIVMGPLGGIYEGEYIGWNAKILPDTLVYFIKLGGGSGGSGEQEGGAVIVTDRFGNMHFQTYRATDPGKDTMPDTTLFNPQITFTYDGDIITHKRGEAVTGVKWNPLGKVLLGSLPLNAITTTSYNLPASVPLDAKEVLVYVYARTGGYNPDADLELRIYTKEGTKEYSYYFFIHGYNQNAWSYNSDNFWLPVTADRKVYVQSVGTAITGNRAGAIYILGYR